MDNYRSPGVYVKEISLFPPSVAEVETAIPAFIGYTEKACKLGPGDLSNVPTTVASLLEYEQSFGGGPPLKVKEVTLDENNAVISCSTESRFYLYDSLRLFFQNGGGKCYIVSIGNYDATPAKEHFEAGLDALRKQDEPTLLLVPDAVLLGDDLYSVQKNILKQCDALMDRFGLFDLLESKVGDATFDWKKGTEDFRGGIDINYLKYGAAYTPWLKANLPVSVHYRDVKGRIFRAGQAIDLDVFIDKDKSEPLKDNLDNLDNAVADVDRINSDIDGLRAGEDTLKSNYIGLVDTFKGGPNATRFKALLKFIYETANKINEWAGQADAIKSSELNTHIKRLISDSLKASLMTLISYDRGGGYDAFKDYDPTKWTVEWDHIFDENHANYPPADTTIFTGGTVAEKTQSAEPKVSLIFSQVNAAVAEIVAAACTLEQRLEDALRENHVVYKSIVAKLGRTLTTLPPSGAIAGVYAMVDRARGVWKAPANVGLAGVVGVTQPIDNAEQDGLNIDVVAGKSINAIRPFTGKGVLVWGARTLAGNDNEWRYIPVRRFFNMVEESVKKSTYWAVFEPNDANTWVKVKSMIENYLIQKWRDGALAGAKADEAFYVKVGLGTTMTPQDILEGRMNVEIGMAVVRPAEFIILKFSHKMQES
jgi:phage tail sheath protein FI